MIPNEHLMTSYNTDDKGIKFCISNSIANRLQREGIQCYPICVNKTLSTYIEKYADVKMSYDLIGTRITLSDLTDEWFKKFVSIDMTTLIVWTGILTVNYFSYCGKIYRDFGYNDTYGVECNKNDVRKNVLDIDKYIHEIVTNNNESNYNFKLANTAVDVISHKYPDKNIDDIRKILFSSYLLPAGTKTIDTEKFFIKNND